MAAPSGRRPTGRGTGRCRRHRCSGPLRFGKRTLARLAEGFLGTDDSSLVERAGGRVAARRGAARQHQGDGRRGPRGGRGALLAPGERGSVMSIGLGYDVHAFAEGRRLVLGGVEIEHERGLLGHSDADVLAHALTDAVLGALREGDIGRLFPDTDPAYRDADSLELLSRGGRAGSRARLARRGCGLRRGARAAQDRALPRRDAREPGRGASASACDSIGVKATTTEGSASRGGKRALRPRRSCCSSRRDKARAAVGAGRLAAARRSTRPACAKLIATRAGTMFRRMREDIRVRQRARPGGDVGRERAVQLSRDSRDLGAPRHALALGARPAWLRALALRGRPLLHRRRDPPGRHARRPLLHRPRHGCGHRRDDDHRRRRHHLSGRDARRNRQGDRQAPPDDRGLRGRRRGCGGARQHHRRAWEQGRRRRGGHRRRAAQLHGRRRSRAAWSCGPGRASTRSTCTTRTCPTRSSRCSGACSAGWTASSSEPRSPRRQRRTRTRRRCRRWPASMRESTAVEFEGWIWEI